MTLLGFEYTFNFIALVFYYVQITAAEFLLGFPYTK